MSLNKTTNFNMGGGLGDEFRNTMSFIGGADIEGFTITYIDPTATKAANSYQDFYAKEISVGRSKHCNIVYDDKFSSVSRMHCKILQRDGSIFLIHNPDASNPTLVNNTVISWDYELKNGDEVRLSYDGPRFRFNTGKSKKSSTIQFTQRLGLAISQATTRLKILIGIISSIFFILLMAGAFLLFGISSENKKLNKEYQQRIETFQTKISGLEEQLDATIQAKGASSAEANNLRRMINENKKIVENLKKELDQKKSGGGSVVQEESATEEWTNQEPVTPPRETSEEPPVVISNACNEDIIAAQDAVVMIFASSITVERNNGVMDWTPAAFHGLKRRELEGAWDGTGIILNNNTLYTSFSTLFPWRTGDFNSLSQELKSLAILEASDCNITVTYTVKSISGDDLFTFDSRSVTEGNNFTQKPFETQRNVPKIGIFRINQRSFNGKFISKPENDIVKISTNTSKSPNIRVWNSAQLPKNAVFNYFAINYSSPQQIFESRRESSPLRYAGLRLRNQEVKSPTVSNAVVSVNLRFSNTERGGPLFYCDGDDIFLIGIGGYGNNVIMVK
jgi:pSer/pThr/pTyr-binding forkhead associated (FHA) protein